MAKNEFQPYSKFAKPFSIGLQLLGDVLPFQPDCKFANYIRQKQALFLDKPDKVFLAEPDTVGAQNEALDFILNTISADRCSNLRQARQTTLSPALPLARNTTEMILQATHWRWHHCWYKRIWC